LIGPLCAALEGPSAEAPGLAWAEVPVRIDACVDGHGIDRAQLGYLVGNELDGVAHDDAVRLREEGATIVLACDGEDVVVAIEGPAARTSRVHTQGLERTVATRTLALAIVELVGDAPEPVPPPVTAPIAPPPVEPAAPPPVKPPPPRRATWLATIGFDALGFPLAPLGLYGGAIAVRHRPSRHFGWMAAVSAHGGRSRDPLGSVHAIAASGSAGAVVHGDWARVDPWGSLGVRGGFASLAGESDDATVETGRVQGGWLGPAARAGVDGFVGRRLVAGAYLELGWAAIATRARIDGSAGPGVAQLWIGGGVSFGLRWPEAAPTRPRARSSRARS
jgi:hypothetical protein